jgi:carbamoyl-phosphate synthase large subunit
VRDADKSNLVPVAKSLYDQGFELVATRGTLRVLMAAGIECGKVNKVAEGRPHIVDMIKNHDIDLIVNTTEGRQAVADSYEIRRAALQNKVAYTTTLAGAEAISIAIKDYEKIDVFSLQEIHHQLNAG